MSDIIPTHYFYLFWLIEPAMTLSGAFYAMFRPGVYADDLIPTYMERYSSSIGTTVRGTMVVQSLGSMFLLLALVAISLLPLIKWQLAGQPALQETFMRGLLLPIAVADAAHIAATLASLPISLVVRPWYYTQLMHGNLTITFSLLLLRCLWFAGIARDVAPAAPAAAHRRAGSHKAE